MFTPFKRKEEKRKKGGEELPPDSYIISVKPSF